MTVVTLGIHIVDILGRLVTRMPDGQHVALLEEVCVIAAARAST